VTLTFSAAEFSLAAPAGSDPATAGLSVQTLDVDVTYSAGNPTVMVATLEFVVLKHLLTVGAHGRGTPPGSGRVTAPGIDCRAACTMRVDHGTVIELRAEPDPGWVFTGWEGAPCETQEGPLCRIAVTRDVGTNATFGPPPPSGPPGNGPPPTPTKPLRGDLVSATAARSPNGTRIVAVVLSLEDEASGTATLTRKLKTIVTKRIASLVPGRHTVMIVVPPRVPAGIVQLTIDLTGAEGARVIWGISVLLPSGHRP
jgi:hypothetical protein